MSKMIKKSQQTMIGLRFLTLILTSSTMMTIAPSYAQSLEELSQQQQAPERQNPENQPSENDAPENGLGSPFDELDALSHSNNNPFGAIAVNKQREPVSVTIRALDKIIARTIDLEIPMNTLVNFGSLEIVPRFCDKRPPEDFPETTAFLEVFDTRLNAGAQSDLVALPTEASTDQLNDQTSLEQTPNNSAIPEDMSMASQTPTPSETIEVPTTGERIFSGWMFASSPGLNALEHAVYDVWVIDCKTDLVSASTQQDSEPSDNTGEEAL